MKTTEIAISSKSQNCFPRIVIKSLSSDSINITSDKTLRKKNSGREQIIQQDHANFYTFTEPVKELKEILHLAYKVAYVSHG